jgi:pimeloyl-ACP methyl ester carboxylesterase
MTFAVTPLNLSTVLLLCCLVPLIAGIGPYKPEDTAPFDELVVKKGYPVTSHWVTTDDGYILQIFRLQAKGQRGMQSKPVVFLMHPLLASADLWILNDEDKSPAYILANQGYDVWFGNIRGNRYTRNHTTLNPDKDAAFWQFTWQDFAHYDLPKMIQFVRNATGKNMDYVGHSQGTLIMLAALSEQNPILYQSVNKVILLGPVWYLKNTLSPLLRKALNGTDPIFKKMGLNVFAPWGPKSSKTFAIFCHFTPKTCREAMMIASFNEPKLDNAKIMPTVAGHAPAGTSYLNMLHFLQMSQEKIWQLRKYDFGPTENMKKYGQPQPPQYDVKKIQKKIHLFAGTVDTLADVADVKQLYKDLPDATYREYYLGHCTFLFGQDTSYFKDVLTLLKSQSQ